jgi:hypothetical protein
VVSLSRLFLTAAPDDFFSLLTSLSGTDTQRSRSASSVVVSGPREGTFRHLVHVSRNSEGKLEVSNVGADGDTGLTTDFLKAFSSVCNDRIPSLNPPIPFPTP